jgi:hypothetical protein
MNDYLDAVLTLLFWLYLLLLHLAILASFVGVAVLAWTLVFTT